jgi:hypothetical protein
MTKFLKLTNFILNANNIYKISIQPNRFVIYVAYKKVDGFLWLIGGFGLGNLSTVTEEVEVCGEKHSTDYKIVSEWINKI